jgi:hypothetical protein
MALPVPEMPLDVASRTSMTDPPKQALGDLAGEVPQSKAASLSQSVSQPFTPKSIAQLAGGITDATSLIEARNALARSSAASALASPGAAIATIDLEAFPGHQVGNDAAAAPEAATVPWPAMSTSPRLGDPPGLQRPLSAPRTTPSIDIEAAQARNALIASECDAMMSASLTTGNVRSLHFQASSGDSLATLPIDEACRMWCDATEGSRSLSIEIRDTLPRLRDGENVTRALANTMTVHGVCNASNFGGHRICVRIRVADMVICAPVLPSRSDRSRSPPRT